MLELRPTGSQIWRTTGTCTEVEAGIEAAHADSTMAFGTQVEFVLNFTPGFLQSISLFGMPFGTIYLLTSLSSTAPKTTK
jgi:hypothetical protein